MGEFSNTAGCAIDNDYIYLARRFDEFDNSVDFTRMSFYDPQDRQAPWKAHDLAWRTVSVCVWRGGLGIERVYVALSTEGDVELIGPGNQPQIVERISGAGLRNPGALRQGLMVRVRQIGINLYACGSGFLTFRRSQVGWSVLDGPSPSPGGDASQGFLDINGHDETAIYAVGPDGSASSCVRFYNGSSWRPLLNGYPGTLTSVTPSRTGGVYIGGWSSVLYGNAKQGFKTVIAEERLFVTDMIEVDGRLYLATTNGLFTTGNTGSVMRVETGLSPELGSISHLDAVSGTLWAFGQKDIAVLEAGIWQRIPDPDNIPRAGPAGGGEKL